MGFAHSFTFGKGNTRTKYPQIHYIPLHKPKTFKPANRRSNTRHSSNRYFARQNIEDIAKRSRQASSRIRKTEKTNSKPKSSALRRNVVEGNKRKFGSYGWGMFGTENTEAVFLLGKSRGMKNLTELNPKPVIGITDDYGAYKNAFTHHQLCWVHPHRKFRDLAESNELSGEQKENCISDFKSFAKIYAKLGRTIKTEFDYEKTKKYFLKKISEFAKPNMDDIPKTKTLKATLLKNCEKYLTVLEFPKLIPLDNNKAERGLRHLIIKRKISYGSKTDRGTETTSILASVLLSLKWMNPDTFSQKYFLEGC